MASPVLDPEIALAFQCKDPSHALSGGEGRSLRIGNCVLKPIDYEARYIWACDLL